MQNIPFDRALVDEIIAKNKIKSVGAASIREVKKIIDDVESATGEKFVRMEMGIPGIPAVQLGVDAEIEALKNGCAAIYPDIYGTRGSSACGRASMRCGTMCRAWHRYRGCTPY